MNRKRQTFLNFSLTRSAYVRIIRKGTGEKSRQKGKNRVAPSSEACGCFLSQSVARSGAARPWEKTRHNKEEYRNEGIQEYKKNKTNPIFPFFNQKRTFAKRTHFQSSRSISASDKSLCRLSAFPIILESLGSWVLKFLIFTKRTHFPHFFANFEDHNSTFNIYHSTFPAASRRQLDTGLLTKKPLQSRLGNVWQIKI
jgi:hypothetical protein